jgi:signal transduction histidine kinase
MSALGQLAAGLAHEIKNPLNAISLNLQMLEEELPPAQRAGEPQALLKATRGEIGRLDALARDFLLYAKPLPLQRRRVALDPLLRELRRLLLPQAEQRRVALELRVDAGLEAAADEGLLRQAVLNLMLNAILFSPPGTTVTIVAESDGVRLKIAVQDKGPGVSPEIREKIFAPFYSTREGGTGLGLAIARRIVKAHGGTLEIGEGEAGESGARFVIELPGEA